MRGFKGFVFGLKAAVLAAAIAVSGGTQARAAYPDQPIRMVVTFPAGGTADVLARLVGAKLSQELKTAVVIENDPGAGGIIATKIVAGASPDGYTLLFTTPAHTIMPAMHKSLPFNVEKDFAPVSLLTTVPMLLVANPSVPFSDFKGFVAYAKAHPGKLTYSSAGIGTLPHVGMELLLHQLGLNVIHVPYKGAAPAMTDLLAGRVQLKLDTIQTSQNFIEAGKLKALGIGSPERDPLMPNVPAFAEEGMPGFQVVLWQGVLAPAKTPKPIIDTLYKAFAKALKDPGLDARFKKDGVHVVASTPDAFAATIKAELGQWAKIVHDAHITVE